MMSSTVILVASIFDQVASGLGCWVIPVLLLYVPGFSAERSSLSCPGFNVGRDVAL